MNINKEKIYLTNIFIIDWDDTLFPTTWINKNNIDLNNNNSLVKYKLYFLELDNTISLLLDSLNKVADIYIVTNASLNWINICLSNLNLTRHTIIKNNIKILSARDLYSQYNNSPTEWKILTFQDIIEQIIIKIDKNIKPNTIINIISIGDAMYEYIALINLHNFIKSYTQKINSKFNYLLKNIKFVERPDFDFVIEQIQVLEKNSFNIINKLEFVDLKFE